MLVFLSDLHFVDGTAGEHNIPAQAFRYFFEDVTGIALKPSNKGRIKEVNLVLLGDIFDLLRTEYWFDCPEQERPWGKNEIAEERHALTILEEILRHPENRQSLKILREDLKKLQGELNLAKEPRLFYIPGNHDRLGNKYSSLRARICDCLGILPAWHNPANFFPHTHEDLAYGVFARHGHEFDEFNYENGGSFREVDYLRVPIGDPITTELVSRLPYELDLILRNEGVPKDQRVIAKRNLQDIDNVRPLSAVVEWLLYKLQSEQKEVIRDAIEKAVDKVAEEFEELDYVKFWYSKHDKWPSLKEAIDHADKIQTFLKLLPLLSLESIDELLKWLEKVKTQEFFRKDKLLEAAPKEYANLDPRFRYVIYGHTHDPLVVPLDSKPAPPEVMERLYFNTGTLRTRHQKARCDKSFMSLKYMSYVIFYRAEERQLDFPVFETWTGTLKTA